MDRLSIRTLGGTEVSRGGQPVQWRAESARTLFLYLLTHPGGRSRAEIINALWDAEPDALLGNRFRVVAMGFLLNRGKEAASSIERQEFRGESGTTPCTQTIAAPGKLCTDPGERAELDAPAGIQGFAAPAEPA